MSSRTSTTDCAAKLEGASRTYGSGRLEVHALRPTDLAIPHGSYMAISGPSGSGKSTLLHVLGCLDRPTTGRYLLDGRDVSILGDMDLARIRNRTIGFVFQRFHLLRDESARRNVELPLLYAGLSRRERSKRALAALDQVGLAHRAAHIPGKLSGGEQQRVALARALVKKPKLLLADEPTGNLDVASGGAVLDLIDRANESGTTVVIITHAEAVASRAKRRVWIRDGVVSGEAPRSEPHRTS